MPCSLANATTRSDVRFSARISLRNVESPRFAGRAVVALAADDTRMTRSGTAVTTEALAAAYGYTDADGTMPHSS